MKVTMAQKQQMSSTKNLPKGGASMMQPYTDGSMMTQGPNTRSMMLPGSQEKLRKQPQK